MKSGAKFPHKGFGWTSSHCISLEIFWSLEHLYVAFIWPLSFSFNGLWHGWLNQMYTHLAHLVLLWSLYWDYLAHSHPPFFFSFLLFLLLLWFRVTLCCERASFHRRYAALTMGALAFHLCDLTLFVGVSWIKSVCGKQGCTYSGTGDCRGPTVKGDMFWRRWRKVRWWGTCGVSAGGGKLKSHGSWLKRTRAFYTWMY